MGFDKQTEELLQAGVLHPAKKHDMVGPGQGYGLAFGAGGDLRFPAEELLD